MANSDAGWHPPNAKELLEKAVPEGSHWYEVRTPLKTLSFPVEKWDAALNDTKVFRSCLGCDAALFYCHKGTDGLHAERLL